MKGYNYTSVSLSIFISAAEALPGPSTPGIHRMWEIHAEQAAAGEQDPAVPVCCGPYCKGALTDRTSAEKSSGDVEPVFTW